MVKFKDYYQVLKVFTGILYFMCVASSQHISYRTMKYLSLSVLSGNFCFRLDQVLTSEV